MLIHSICFGLVVVLLVSCGSDTGGHGASSEEVAQLVAKHNVVRDWVALSSGMGDEYRSSGPYTIEIEEAVTSNLNVPILFVGWLDDIWKSDSGYICYFEVLSSWFFGTIVNVELRCDRAQVDYFLSYSDSGMLVASGYAVVAKISDFERPKFGINILIDEVDPYSSEIIAEFPMVVVLRGTLTEALYVEDIYELRDQLRSKALE